MKAVKCSNGHYYDGDLESCPVCAAAGKTSVRIPIVPVEDPLSKVEKCSAGHIYDKTLGSCPICAEKEKMVRNSVCCPEGHRYDPAISKVCPVCTAMAGGELPTPEKEGYTVVLDGPVQEKPENESLFDIQEEEKVPFCDLTQMPDPNNTLIYTAYGRYSFRLWLEQGSFLLQVRSVEETAHMIPQKTVCIPSEDAKAAAREILSLLSRIDRDQTFADQSKTGRKNARLFFNTKQLYCDYCWNSGSGLSASPDEYNMRQIHTILGRVIGSHDSRQDSADQEILAELELGHAFYQLIGNWGEYSIRLQEQMYYEFVSMILLEASVEVPEEDVQTMTDWLYDCGAMEVLMKKNKRAGETVCIDPGFGTAFRLKDGGLNFSYRDWNKVNIPEESAVLSKVRDQFLEWMRKYAMQENNG